MRLFRRSPIHPAVSVYGDDWARRDDDSKNGNYDSADPPNSMLLPRYR
ncbi:MAG: hypothetical protein KME11_22560 [Timaviella obliquedivisa GSE-PSE-MK23-08B]|nr:hypothetical protein [Timaviella obliquedivisa GSE-PSE-MK23-08B]